MKFPSESAVFFPSLVSVRHTSVAYLLVLKIRQHTYVSLWGQLIRIESHTVNLKLYMKSLSNISTTADMNNNSIFIHRIHLRCTFPLIIIFQGLMPDGTSRFSIDGKVVYHFMGCSTFSGSFEWVRLFWDTSHYMRIKPIVFLSSRVSAFLYFCVSTWVLDKDIWIFWCTSPNPCLLTVIEVALPGILKAVL